MFLLDTDTCSFVLRSRYGVSERIALRRPDELFVSAITVAEAWTGARKSERRQRIERQWEYFLGPFRDRILPFDELAADRYGTLRAHLELRGAMIGDHDAMIAAIALARGLTVVTRNAEEFCRVPGLPVEDWTDR